MTRSGASTTLCPKRGLGATEKHNGIDLFCGLELAVNLIATEIAIGLPVVLEGQNRAPGC